MTFTDDFLDEKQGLEEEYPSAFGITFTPMISGLALSILGVVGAAYIYFNMASEARTQYQEVQTQVNDKQAQLNQISQADFPEQMANLQAELAEQKALKSRVNSMFTNQNDLETLLIDLNNFVTSQQGELIQYTPDAGISIINDGSLGNEVQGKLKRKSFSLEINGTFNQTQAIIKDIERLQPLLMIQNYSSKITDEPTAILTSNRNEVIPQNSAVLSTSLKIDAILPMSQQELEAARQAEKEAAEAEAEAEQK